MSRIHDLAKLQLLDLIAVLNSLYDAGNKRPYDRIPRYGWDKDLIIAQIRELENPRETP
jgi:hypothetical protein